MKIGNVPIEKHQIPFLIVTYTGPKCENVFGSAHGFRKQPEPRIIMEPKHEAVWLTIFRLTRATAILPGVATQNGWHK